MSVDGAERMRRAARIIAAINDKLQAHQPELGRASVVHITCRYDKTGKLEVQIQTTFS